MTSSSIPNAGFTPGPWFAERRKHCSVVRQPAVRDDYSSRIAECPQWSPAPRNQPGPDEAFANANLIASAPDLYAALVRLGTLAAAKYGASDDELWGAITQGIAACAKARGEA